ncbi:pyruvate formate lyase activating enzyme [Rhodobium orientis]|uniref:Pyruvate formate-lyase-activating enzyme n=1 Tax=Rhodobium orientis TaxID=34017 RepID=A0A327JKM6_9HYPH|nr:pyruvate formate-lyase-activating protein [Rhodobium orientis]MBB4305008.1 pyruvate formate lyase activating enzyme [Rhodobium orientis]MBK5948784.1 pyruvate formate-lyase 1-activating enzyme [Rhodobium orientis]RAI26455.1 pyruvate formate-lyase 1-activating enzyme [Rhodobium orientis]
MDARVHHPHPVAGVHHDADHGFLHSVETGGAIDGPGVRFVFFMAGCLFRCLYCHNPDTWKLHNGRRVDADDMLEELARYAGFLKLAGGVTFSGGEPLMQAAFVGQVTTRIKEELGLHIALDTQGFLHESLDDDWFNPVDLVMLDIKHIDPLRYEKLTAQPLQPTLDFAHRLKAMQQPAWIRYVLVPGLTDGADDVARMADFVAGLGPNIERVEVLPFHQMGASKWAELNKPYALADTPTPDDAATEAARDVFRARGLVAS